MDLIPYIKYIAVLILVLGLIGLLAWIGRKMGMVPKADGKRGDRKRLGVTQVTSIDAKRKLVLVRRDDQEHLLLLGPERDLVIEQNIQIRKPETPKEVFLDEDMPEEAGKEPSFAKLPPLHERVNPSK